MTTWAWKSQLPHSSPGTSGMPGTSGTPGTPGMPGTPGKPGNPIMQLRGRSYLVETKAKKSNHFRAAEPLSTSAPVTPPVTPRQQASTSPAASLTSRNSAPRNDGVSLPRVLRPSLAVPPTSNSDNLNTDHLRDPEPLTGCGQASSSIMPSQFSSIPHPEGTPESSDRFSREVTSDSIGEVTSQPKADPDSRSDATNATSGPQEHEVGNIRVAVRVRPQLPGDDDRIIEVPSEHVIQIRKQGATGGNEFLSSQQRRTEERWFDRVFGPQAAQADVYAWSCQPLIKKAVFEAKSATLFVYGATGAGKTHTMFGERDEVQQGLIYRALNEIFGSITPDLIAKVSFLEIYNESVRDLLQVCSGGVCKIMEDERRGVVKVTNLRQVPVISCDDALRQLRNGMQLRKVQATAANSRSSRSHAVFTVSLERVEWAEGRFNEEMQQFHSKICFIDLAGSERASQTQNVGAELKVGAKINQSLLALMNCIDALGDRCREGAKTPTRKPPYRDSKLTLLLKESFLGEGMLSMIANVHPDRLHFEDSSNTLEYAKRVSILKKEVIIRREPPLPVQHFRVPRVANLLGNSRTEVGYRTNGAVGRGDLAPRSHVTADSRRFLQASPARPTHPTGRSGDVDLSQHEVNARRDERIAWGDGPQYDHSAPEQPEQEPPVASLLPACDSESSFAPPTAEKSDWLLNSPLFGSSLDEGPDLAEPASASCIMRAAKAAQAYVNVPSLRLEATAGSLAAQDHAAMAALRKGVLADLSSDGVEFLLTIIDFLKAEKVGLDAELRSRNEECSQLRAANLEKDQQLSLLRGWLVEESLSLSLHLKGVHC